MMLMVDSRSVGTLLDRAFTWRKAERIQVGGDLEGRWSHKYFAIGKEWLILIVFLLVPSGDVVSGVVVGVVG